MIKLSKLPAFAFLLLILICPFFLAGLPQESSQTPKKEIEPLSAESKQWLEEVVPYIITSAEKELFLNLPSEAERGKFIQNFWKKRDPISQTPENEFKLDYFRRIAMANKFFEDSGIEGWRTDRGKVYILLGPPNEIQRDFSPSGSASFGFQGPKETWNYWGLTNPNLPYNLEFVFVDKLSTGNYVLERGLQLGKTGSTPFELNNTHLFLDSMEVMADALKNPFEGLEKLKGMITTQVTYDRIPIDCEAFHLKGEGGATFIPLSLEIPYSAVSPQMANGKLQFNLTLMIDVSDKLGQVVYERSKDISFEHSAAEREALKGRTFQLQISLALNPDEYKIHFLILDNVSGKVGTLHQELPVPNFSGTQLLASDIILTANQKSQPIEIGAAAEKISFPVSQIFHQGEEMTVHIEAYNLSLNPSTEMNDFRVEYIFLQNDKLLTRVPAADVKPTQEKDCRVNSSMVLKNFKPGVYGLRVIIQDLFTGKQVTKETRFTVSQ